MSETVSREVELLGEPVEYKIRRSEQASQARIDVGLRGVTVVIPTGSSRDPEKFLAENAAWVLERRGEFEQYRKQIPDRQFEPGEQLPFLGEPHEIVVETRSTNDVEDGAFRLAEHHVEQTSVKRALETLYRRKARERFEERADHFAEQMGVTYDKIEVRNQRTKWGSCSSSGTLGLNWRLMMAPPEIVDYVIVHELAHLRVRNHSDEFWDLVEEHNPDYATHAEWLQEHSPKLIFSDEDW